MGFPGPDTAKLADFQPSRRDLLRYGMLLGAAALVPSLGADVAVAAEPAATLADTPTKTTATLYTAEKVAAARRNVAQYGWAQTVRDSAAEKADPLVAKGDEWLWTLVTGQGVPRSYAVNQALGSPITGQDIYRFGNYPWLADPLGNPWKLVDPSVPEGSGLPRIYPTNDFGAFYASGLDEHGNFDRALADRTLLVNELYPEKGPTWGVDDGFGWVDDNGAKWTFIPYYNHWWLWYGTTAPIYFGLTALRDSYICTGDVRYARAGLILLDRIADVYPSMDTAPYPRADGYFHSDGLTGKGKVVGSIWETGIAQTICDAYDAFFPAIATTDDANVVPFLAEKARQHGLPAKDSPAAIRVNIENGILRQVYPNVKGAKIRGNFGMHQRAIALAGVVLDSPAESREWIDFIFQTGGVVSTPDWHVTGGDVYRTVVDVVDRDGFGNEASPGYNRLWIGHIRGIADILSGYSGYPAADLYEHPKFRKMFQGMHPLVMLGAYTPQIGDTGSTGNPGLFGSANEFFHFFDKFGLPEYAQMAYLMGGNNADNLYGDLFSPDVPGTQQRIRDIIAEHGPLHLPSENLTGYGFAALRDGAGDKMRDVWVYYGRTTGHGHYDALNLGMHGFGVDLLPDLGYPEFADNSIRTREWNENTIAHNTVMVDNKPQASHWVGQPYGFAVTDRVQVCDIAAPKVYPQTSTYRRVSAMVKVDDTNFYAVDVFRVVGGADHHFSFHAAEGPATAEGLTLVAQPTGTYAGPDVPMPPDDAPPQAGANGFRWLDKVSRDADSSGPFNVDWKVTDTWGVHDPDPNLHLRLTMLSDVDDVALCDGTPPRNKPGNPAKLRYLIAHRRAPAGEQLASQFVSLVEPYVDRRAVRSVSTVAVLALDGTIAPHEVTAVRVELTNGRVDYVVSAAKTDVMLKVDMGEGKAFTFRGSFGVYSTRRGEPEYACSHGASFVGPLPEMQGPAAATGTLQDFTRDLSVSNQLVVQLDEAPPAKTFLDGGYVYVENDGVRNAVYRIRGARFTGETTVTLDIGDITTVRGYVDPEDFSKGFEYDVAAGAKVTVPFTRQWKR